MEKQARKSKRVFKPHQYAVDYIHAKDRYIVVIGPRGESKTSSTLFKMLYFAKWQWNMADQNYDVAQDNSGLWIVRHRDSGEIIRGEYQERDDAEGFLDAMKSKPLVRCLVLRDTKANLGRTVVQGFKRWLPDGDAIYRGDKQIPDLMQFPTKNPYLETVFMGCDSPQDLNKLQGAEFAKVVLEEPAPAGDVSNGISEDVFAVANTCLRQAGMIYYQLLVPMNPPDENHWTVKKLKPLPNCKWIVFPKGANTSLSSEYRKENERGLIAAGRADLVERLVEGRIGPVLRGPRVTPEFGEGHITDVRPVPNPEKRLDLLWDFGRTPVCIITQVNYHWFFYYTLQGVGTSLEEHIEQVVRPILRGEFPGFRLRHITDPQVVKGGEASKESCQDVLTNMLPGPIIPGPISWPEREQSLRAALRRSLSDSIPLIQVFRHENKELIGSFRGEWHYHKDSTGKVYERSAVKNEASHPGDAAGYGAAILFPLGRMLAMEEFPEYVRPVGKDDPLDMYADIESENGDITGWSRTGLPIFRRAA